MKKVLVIAFFFVISGNMLWSATQVKTKCHGTAAVSACTSVCTKWYVIAAATPGVSPNSAPRAISLGAENSESKRDHANQFAAAELIEFTTKTSQKTKKLLEKNIHQLEKKVTEYNEQIELAKKKSKQWALAIIAGACFMRLGAKSGFFEYLMERLERFGPLGELLPTVVMMASAFPVSAFVEGLKDWWRVKGERDQAVKKLLVQQGTLKSASETDKTHTARFVSPGIPEHDQMVKSFTAAIAKGITPFTRVRETSSESRASHVRRESDANASLVENTNDTTLTVFERRFVTAS